MRKPAGGATAGVVCVGLKLTLVVSSPLTVSTFEARLLGSETFVDGARTVCPAW